MFQPLNFPALITIGRKTDVFNVYPSKGTTDQGSMFLFMDQYRIRLRI
jgi:hypothetical protein